MKYRNSDINTNVSKNAASARLRDGSVRGAFFRSTSIIYMALSLFVLTSIVGCQDFLNYTETDEQEKEDILAYYEQVKTMVNALYVYLPTDYNSVGGAMRSSASDDAEHVWDTSDIQKFNDGTWSPIALLDNQWSKMYTAIRAANTFLQDGTGLKFENIQYNDNYSQFMQQYKLLPYEARFLRAFFYFELIKRYGDVPLVTTPLTREEANSATRTPVQQIVEFIAQECDSAAANLPVSYSTIYENEYGRATQGAARALKSRALLYAASPLFNSTNDQTKWINAAKAAKNLIDVNGASYTPLPAYSKVVNDITSQEMIFEVKTNESNSFEINNTAVGIWGGKTGTCPTQNLVDSYEMQTTGKGINETGSGYDPTNPYAGRDPRMDMTILHNGSVWQSPRQIETFYGGANAAPIANTTLTGYYLKKYLVESISLNPASMGKARHAWIIFRYAEVLLNYAEAMNEAYGPDAAGPAPLDNLTARAAVNLVRQRTGVAMPDFPTGMSKDAFRDKLRNERRVELAFEDHRFWDIRRWKIGSSTTVIKGMNIVKDANTGVLTYTPKTVETRVWNDKMYLYPLPQNELFINENFLQNPGWN